MDGFRLVMTQGPEPGQTFTLDRDTLTIGRDPTSEVAIIDAQVSRQHSRLVRQGNVVLLEDLGSTNGTFVNGVRVTTSHALSNGDVIALGDAVKFTFYGQTTGIEETLVGGLKAAAMPEAGAPAYTPPPAPAAAPPSFSVDAEPVEAEEKKSKRWVWILIVGAGIVFVACLVVAIFLWFAPESFWQTLIDWGIPVPSWPLF